jgi:hypothetical protein
MGTRFVEFEFLTGDLRAAVRRHIHLEAFVCCRVVIGGRECAALLAVGVQLKVGRIVEREVELRFLIGEVSGRRDVCRRGIFRIRSYRRGIDTKNGSANRAGQVEGRNLSLAGTRECGRPPPTIGCTHSSLNRSLYTSDSLWRETNGSSEEDYEAPGVDEGRCADA